MNAIDSTMIYIVPFIAVYIIFSTWLSGKFMYLREKRGRYAESKLTAYLSEHLSYFSQIKQLHSQDEEIQKGKEAIEQFYRADIYQAVITLLNLFVSGSLTNIISILIFVLGVPRVNDGSITITELAAFQSYMLIAYQSISSVPDLYTSFMYYNGILFYISGLMAEKEEAYGREQSMDIEDQELQFRNVTFGYGDEDVIKNASFTIPKGKWLIFTIPSYEAKEIQNLSRTFYAEFLPSAKYNLRGTAELEYYHDGITEFLVPIR